MYVLVVLLFVCFLLELASGLLSVGLFRKLLIYLGVFIISADSIALLCLRPALWTALIAYFSAFRVLNLFKLIDGRKQVDYIRSSFLRTSYLLNIFQIVVLIVYVTLKHLTWSYHTDWTIVICLQLAVVVIVGMSLRRGLSKTRPRLTSAHQEERALPTLSVAIPARNETDDLDACLQSLIASDYPKLEVLVLDDCSQESRTPEIIRQFAQSGVRFLAGKEPSDSWTAKNYAYEQLSNAANGDIIMFAGVDVRFDRQTVRQMVELMLSKHKTMASFMPVNKLPEAKLRRLLIQPLRYLWELGIPRRFFNRPPVLSTCWLIDRQALKANGGFSAVSRSIVPERYFARQTARKNDGYSFICLGKTIGLGSNKSFDEQFSTGVRTRYPLLKQRPEIASLLVLAEFAIFIGPIGLLIYGLAIGGLLFTVVSAISIATSAFIVLKISKLTYDVYLPLGLIAYPLVFAYDIGLLMFSMWRYEFSEVVWKGRNVCVPVMQIQTATDPKPVSNSV